MFANVSELPLNVNELPVNANEFPINVYELLLQLKKDGFPANPSFRQTLFSQAVDEYRQLASGDISGDAELRSSQPIGYAIRD